MVVVFAHKKSRSRTAFWNGFLMDEKITNQGAQGPERIPAKQQQQQHIVQQQLEVVWKFWLVI